MLGTTPNREMVQKSLWLEVAPTFEYLAVACEAIGKLFMTPPDNATFSAMSEMDMNQAISDIGAAEIVEGIQLIHNYARQGESAQRILDAVADHSRLFVGPMHVFAPPWSSVYLDSGMLNGPSAQAVAQTYRRTGVQIQNPGKEPADHIAYEMTFIAELSRRIQSALDTQEYDRAQQTLLVLHKFCSEHLMQWIELFCDRVEEHAQTDLYRGLAKLTRGVVHLTTVSVSQISEKLGSTSQV
jgi:TorA maturation chaperone TorD